MPELVIPGITDPRTLSAISRARTLTYYKELVANALSGRCPFCMPSSDDEIIVKNTYWRASHNRISPIKQTSASVVITPLRHIITSDDLLPEEQETFFPTVKLVRQILKCSSSGLISRDGDARLLAGTIEHLHFHIVVPNGIGRVETPIYKGAAEDAEDMHRATAFEKLRLGAPIDHLDATEWDLVKDRLQ